MDKNTPTKRDVPLKACIAISGLVYLISFFLPVLAYNKETQLYGFQAFILSFELILLLPASIIQVLLITPSNLFLVLSWYFIIKEKRGYFIMVSITLTSMFLSGILVPAAPSNSFIRTPGGALALGYYLWITAGAFAFIAASRLNSIQENESQDSNHEHGRPNP